eukprot:TRINITY_DN25361_c0_g1_i2.p1 TRINITY_DN25361_c0_g1~~TRINITY_DN25361_c0_g1_i2.p1  ORF type:complete len:380 (+),score=79.14 TRINITY_DN25361_c0_g1_i2:88-1227(+)
MTEAASRRWAFIAALCIASAPSSWHCLVSALHSPPSWDGGPLPAPRDTYLVSPEPNQEKRLPPTAKIVTSESPDSSTFITGALAASVKAALQSASLSTASAPQQGGKKGGGVMVLFNGPTSLDVAVSHKKDLGASGLQPIDALDFAWSSLLQRSSLAQQAEAILPAVADDVAAASADATAAVRAALLQRGGRLTSDDHSRMAQSRKHVEHLLRRVKLRTKNETKVTGGGAADIYYHSERRHGSGALVLDGRLSDLAMGALKGTEGLAGSVVDNSTEGVVVVFNGPTSFDVSLETKKAVSSNFLDRPRPANPSVPAEAGARPAALEERRGQLSADGNPSADPRRHALVVVFDGPTSMDMTIRRKNQLAEAAVISSVRLEG